MACEMEVDFCSRNYLDFNDLSKQETYNQCFKHEEFLRSPYSSPAKSQDNGSCNFKNNYTLYRDGPNNDSSRALKKSNQLKRHHAAATEKVSNGEEDSSSRESLALLSKVIYHRLNFNLTSFINLLGTQIIGLFHSYSVLGRLN